MKKVIRLTESKLVEMIQNIISEQKNKKTISEQDSLQASVNKLNAAAQKRVTQSTGKVPNTSPLAFDKLKNNPYWKPGTTKGKSTLTYCDGQHQCQWRIYQDGKAENLWDKKMYTWKMNPDNKMSFLKVLEPAPAKVGDFVFLESICSDEWGGMGVGDTNPTHYQPSNTFRGYVTKITKTPKNFYEITVKGEMDGKKGCVTINTEYNNKETENSFCVNSLSASSINTYGC